MGCAIATLLLGTVAMPLAAQPVAAPVPASAPDSVVAPVASAARVRAQAIVAEMTLDEKLLLVHSLFPPKTKADPHGELIPSAGHVPPIPRLGIPIVRESDASLGVANQVEQRKGDTATALPSGLATAASFDPEIARAGGAMIGAEARAKRFNILLAGGVNLTRDPWNGRNFEYMGEDPLLAGRMAGAAIAGVQSNRIVSTVKHYVLNAQETGRMVLDARIGEAALRESDLLAFEIAIEIGRPGSVMCAYNKINGDWGCENPHLLTDVLKQDWGYEGWVMSDWGGVHSTVKAANAGLDQQSGQELDHALYFGAALEQAVASGAVPMARLDDMVTRILTGMIANGVLDAPMSETALPIDYAGHAKVAQRAAEAGIVLLRNAGRVLPLARSAKRIVLIGGHADVGVLSGGGSSQVRSVGGAPVEIPLTEGAAASFARVTWHASSPLKAIRAMAPGAEVIYLDGRDRAAAAKAAAGADVAIVFATQWTTEAEDVDSLSLPHDQDALIAAVAAANRNSVVVLETGGPVLMPWLDTVPAVIAAWYPGQRGGEAIANVLFGAVNPSGRLPITFPKAAAQAPRPAPVGRDVLGAAGDAAANADAPSDAAPVSFPVDYIEGSDVGYRWYEKMARPPAFSFGYGLSYTAFAYRNLKVTGGDRLTVSVDVTNTGARAGADVPQLYVGHGDTPMRLADFRRVTLGPGETQRVTFVGEPRVLADYDIALPGWRIAGGPYRVAVGHNAADRALTATATLSERTMRP
ncbi:glycoside hydrolase family 3 C-terminal domain-containing protein [Hephaestia sp. GCM10023244]|uniref:beta-glucosidase n=1 Tax=unclassified Hephaestia TaxID=2631281 RepID=UPI0020771325|nr:beta-glucosidase [Hephaestia sp. MAHUQ-44]MCM8731719.1 beta-glucosidase [Hephaestia sp. MAHUQ-44]